jgi:hypothetical protein
LTSPEETAHPSAPDRSLRLRSSRAVRRGDRELLVVRLPRLDAVSFRVIPGGDERTGALVKGRVDGARQ